MTVLAAVDIGANSVRLKVARLERRKLRVLHEDREVLRLGDEVFRHGRLSPDAMERAVKALRRFQKATRRLGAATVSVVATSPLREADNAEELVAWAEAATGWRIQTISGMEEGRLIHLGVLAHRRLRTQRVLLVDLGGGSCEITLSRGHQIERLFSLPLGAVRLTGAFLGHDPPRPAELTRLHEAIRGELAPAAAAVRRARVQLTIATSGTAAALAGAAGGGGRVSRAAAGRLAAALAAERARERAARTGIGPRRAEIIVAGAAVFQELLEQCGLASFAYSPLGLRDGLLAQMAAERNAAPSYRQRMQADRERALLAAAHHYGVDLAHARRVRAWSHQLFTQLQPLHRLPPAYRDLLEAAALLHEVGHCINRAGRRRHARYILSNTELLGFRQEDCRRIGALARCLGNLRPLPGERVLRSLGVNAALELPRAIVLLRLAAALEQSRRGAVRALRIRRSGQRVRLLLTPRRGGAALEAWAIEKERGYFRAVFGLDLAAGLA